MMKRLLLNLISIFMLSVPFMTNGEEIDFGYCGPIKEPFFGDGNAVGTVYGAAMEIPQATAGNYKGCTISAISVGFGTAAKCEVELFVSTDLSQSPAYTQTATVKPREFTTIPLTKPFRINGETLFIGYRFVSTSMSDSPLAFDRDRTILSEYGHWVSNPYYPDMYNRSWERYYPNYGNVCVRAIIEGTPSEGMSASPESVRVPALVRPDSEFTANLTVLNASSTLINNIEILWTAGSNSGSCSYTFDTPFKTGSKQVASFRMTATEINDALPLTFSISKVNGEPNDLQDTQLTATTTCSWNYSMRNVLAEKNTGNACGWCPSGIVGFEMMEKEVTDGSFIPIEVHNYNYPSDPMRCESYLPWNDHFTGSNAPRVTLNRQNEFETPNYDILMPRYEEIRNTITDVDIRLDTRRAGDSAEVTASVHFSNDHSGIDYGVGFILTEDGVGPYPQRNYYAGGGNGVMRGWEDKGSSVSMIYNDVAREIFDWNGAEGSIPVNVEAGNTYTWVKTLSLAKCTNHDKVKVTAFVADRKTYEILNAIRAQLGTSVGIDTTESIAEAAKVNCKGGILSVEGDYERAYVYMPDGSLITTIRPGQQRVAPEGILLIRIEGGSSDGKVLKTVAR